MQFLCPIITDETHSGNARGVLASCRPRDSVKKVIVGSHLLEYAQRELSLCGLLRRDRHSTAVCHLSAAGSIEAALDW